MPYDAYSRFAGLLFMALGCYLFYTSWKHFRMSLYLMRHGTLTKGQWQTNRQVQFVTNHGMRLAFTSFTSSAALKKREHLIFSMTHKGQEGPILPLRSLLAMNHWQVW